jgi:alpha-beta hydrolase superfamily lysophospholipase
MRPLAAAALALLAACGPVVRPAGPPTRQPAIEAGALVTRDGARLPLERWAPDGQPRAVILALHSFGDFRLGMAPVGRWFAERGVAVYAYDQRGFGEAPHFGLWAGSATLIDDLADAVRAVRAEAPGRPLHLLGESMGGAVILALMGRADAPEVAGLLLAAPGVREGVRLRYLWDVLMWTGAHVAPSASLTVRREEEPRLSAEAKRRFAADPRIVREVRADAYEGLLDLSDEASAAADRVRAPAFIMYGGADGFVRQVSICAAFRGLDGPRLGLLYPDAPHLILQWREAERLFVDMAAWMEGREPPSLAGPARPLAGICGE